MGTKSNFILSAHIVGTNPKERTSSLACAILHILFNRKRKQLSAKNSQPPHSPLTCSGHGPVISPIFQHYTRGGPYHSISMKSYCLPKDFIKVLTVSPPWSNPATCRPCKQQCKTRTRMSRNWRRKLKICRKPARNELLHFLNLKNGKRRYQIW